MDKTRKRTQPIMSSTTKIDSSKDVTMIADNSNDNSWLHRLWRPAMGWQYLIVCLFDFMLAPMFMAWFSIFTKTPMVQWVPLTVQGGGLYHLAMGAVVGITSYAKSQERTALINSPYAPAPGQIQNQPDPER